MKEGGSADRDIRDAAATLIGQVGRIAQDARRYRALAVTVADPTFDRILQIGTAIRRADRAGECGPIADAVEEMRALLHRCEQGIRDVQASTSYRELVVVLGTGPVARATELAATIFADVRVEVAGHPLFWTVPIAARRSPEHFIPPDQCAGRIREVRQTGISAPTGTPDLGGDASIRPLRLATTIDGSDGPISLVYPPAALPGPIGRLTESDVALWYAKSLRASFTVRAAATVNDEWWQVRPAAYAAYLERLGNELAAAGIPFEIAATALED